MSNFQYIRCQCDLDDSKLRKSEDALLTISYKGHSENIDDEGLPILICCECRSFKGFHVYEGDDDVSRILLNETRRGTTKWNMDEWRQVFSCLRRVYPITKQEAQHLLSLFASDTVKSKWLKPGGDQ